MCKASVQKYLFPSLVALLLQLRWAKSTLGSQRKKSRTEKSVLELSRSEDSRRHKYSVPVSLVYAQSNLSEHFSVEVTEPLKF